MTSGKTLAAAHVAMDSGTAALFTWHMRARTPARLISDILTEHGIPTGITTVKVYRQSLTGQPDPEGAGDHNPGLYHALAELRRDIEDGIVADNQLSILTIDIERIPGEFTGEFWDLNDYKGRRINPAQVTAWPRTICVAAKWLHDPTPRFEAEWEVGHEQMIRNVWGLLDEADIVVTQNGIRFDVPHLRGEWSTYGMSDPSPFKQVDTLRIARGRYKFESNTLASLCERYGVPTKTDKYDPRVARAALDGDTAAQDRLKAYNLGDITATEALYNKMRLNGHIPGHPPVTTALPLRCNACGSGDMTPMPKPYLANVMAYQAYRCNGCGTILRGRKGHRYSDLRGVTS